LAKVLRLEDALQYAQEHSETISRLRWFEAIAALRIELGKAEADLAAARVQLVDQQQECELVVDLWRQKLHKAEADLTALRAERDELIAVMEKHGVPRWENKPLHYGIDMLFSSMNRTREALIARAEQAEKELAEARARLALPADSK
jgi:hypothetical protein